MIPRLNYDADSFADIRQYLATRALQLASCGYTWEKDFELSDNGVATHFRKDDRRFVVGFVPLSLRGQGRAEKMLKADGNEVVTVDDCDIEMFLEQKNIPHRFGFGIFDTIEYKMIEQFYGDQRAKRSGVLKMNHIDEGILIMQHFDATKDAMRAFCLHPMLQEDQDLRNNFDYVVDRATPGPIALAMEYRSFANAWLSDKVIEVGGLAPYLTWDEPPRLSPLHDVNIMLIADKVQNYKDFIQYHSKTHARRLHLDKYFKTWLELLAITQFQFEQLRGEIEAVSL